MNNLSTDYDVRLATLKKLGGDMSKKYATIYDVDLAILEKTGQGGGGGGVTIEEVDAEIDSKLTGYATESWVQNQGYLTEHQSLEGYATETWVDGKLTGYAKKTDIPSLDGYATELWVQNQGYLTEHQSLADYATKEELNSKLDVTEVWSGTQAEWDALPVETQNNIKIALITE